MDDQIRLLFHRSQELIEISRNAHAEAGILRQRLQRIDCENSDVIKRAEQSIRESKEIQRSLVYKSSLGNRASSVQDLTQSALAIDFQ